MRATPLLLALSLLAACEARQAKRAQPATTRPALRVHMGDWFDTGAGRCRVSSGQQLLTESAALPFPGARVRPDVTAIDLSFACESAHGGPARSREALPVDAFALLRDADGRVHAPRTGSDEGRDHLLFELGEGAADVVPAPRRFETEGGGASVPRERAVGTLEIRAPSLAVDVVLRPKFLDSDFDALLEKLARGLARGADLSELGAGAEGAAALRALSELYAEVQQHFAAARLELADARPTAPGQGSDGESILAVLELTRPQRAAQSAEVARFELRLVRDARGGLRVAAFENREAARQALQCKELEADLSARVARSEARGGESCNVLGLLVPGRCDEKGELIERALSVRARCRDARAPRKDKAAAPPGDFQLSLRRGRPERGLDRHPRYLVTVFGSGQVIFHGRHWVSSKERSDGRTARSLVAGLYAQLTELEWFARRRSATSEACAMSEQGDVITVRANGRERMVLDRSGCREPFSETELDELKRRVEAITGVEGWTAPRPASTDDKVEHWTLAESSPD